MVLHGLVTAVGGYDSRQLHKDVNKLVSLVDGKWVEQHPPMPTARHYAMAVVATTTSNQVLIVSGGSVGNNMRIGAVEVMDMQNKMWQRAENLPLPLSSASVCAQGDDLYLVGGFSSQGEATGVAYTCKISGLVHSAENVLLSGTQSPSSLSPWKKLTDTPTTYATCALVNGHLISIGGLKSSKRPTGDLLRYDPSANLWEVVGCMPTPRCCHCAATLEGGELMVVGGTNRQLRGVLGL